MQATGRQLQRAPDGTPLHDERHRPEQTTLYRGFCPSCGARRMSQTAAHRVDHVIPHVPVRQRVLPLPILLRVLLAAQPELIKPVLHVVQRVVTRHLLQAAGRHADEGQGGAVTLIQRFGSAANNIHLHCQVLDGVYRCGADGQPASWARCLSTR